VQRLRADLGAVGIVLEVEEVTWPELSRRIRSHEAPAFLLGWIADLAEPDAFLRPLFASDGAANYFGLQDTGIDDLLEEGGRETNSVRRAEVYRRLERRVLEQAPLVPLYHSLGVLAMRREVRGLEPGPLGLAIARLERVSLEPAESRR
jgi:ABC-type oligopeptide transport system substrate-binding subunit